MLGVSNEDDRHAGERQRGPFHVTPSCIYSVYDIRTDIRPTVAEVDLGALRKNASVLSTAIGPKTGLLAVLKADAYGHGAVACARALERQVWGFAVSLVEEGIELRRSGVTAPIVVLGSFYGFSHRDVVSYRLTPVVSDARDLVHFARAVEETGSARLRIHVKIDTGMARLGLRRAELPAFLEAFRHQSKLELEGLCTHLGEADGVDEKPSQAQLQEFEAARALFSEHNVRPLLLHLANSAGILRFESARGDLVRPGLALYGYGSGGFCFAGLSPALQLKTRVVALRDLPAGAAVSYGALFRTQRPTRVATLPIGYADGYARSLTGKAQVLVAEKRAPVLGAITMDLCMIDVTDVPCQLGDEVVLIGRQGSGSIWADEVAAWANTIPWEVFCAISKRVPRVYVGDR